MESGSVLQVKMKNFVSAAALHNRKRFNYEYSTRYKKEKQKRKSPMVTGDLRSFSFFGASAYALTHYTNVLKKSVNVIAPPALVGDRRVCL
jgi:hypothetical protein